MILSIDVFGIFILIFSVIFIFCLTFVIIVFGVIRSSKKINNIQNKIADNIKIGTSKNKCEYCGSIVDEKVNKCPYCNANINKK